jgi:hypothetical protein
LLNQSASDNLGEQMVEGIWVPASGRSEWNIFNDSEDAAFSWLLSPNLSSDAAPSDTSTQASDSIGHEHLLAMEESISVSPVHARESASLSSAAAVRIFSDLRPTRTQAALADGMLSTSCNEEAISIDIDSSKASEQTQLQKRRKPNRGTANDHEADSSAHRKLQRREKNLTSVREFRKRKMKQLELNEDKLRRLKAENMDLKMRLKIGKQALATELREKRMIKDQMREMLAGGASEHELAQFLDMYKVTYSDYGPKRRDKLHFHLDSIRDLLLPTQVTKLCLYSVEQGVNMLERDGVIREDPMTEPDSAVMSLWSILAETLEVSEAQQRKILERREAILMIRRDLEHALAIVKQLEDVIDSKNTALEAQVTGLQRILTPTQATRFIIWVKENPAFMYMLDKLVDSTLITTEA